MRIRAFFKDEWNFNDRYIYLTFEPGNNGRMYSRLSPHCESRLLEFKSKLFAGRNHPKKDEYSLRMCWLNAVKLYTVAILNGRSLDSEAIYDEEFEYIRDSTVITGWNKSYIFPKSEKSTYSLIDMDVEFIENFHSEPRKGVFDDVVWAEFLLPGDVEDDDEYFNAFPRCVPGFALLTYEEKAGRERAQHSKGTFEEDSKKKKEYDVINGIFESSQPPAMVRGTTKEQWKEEENAFQYYCAYAHPGRMHDYIMGRPPRPLHVGVGKKRA